MRASMADRLKVSCPAGKKVCPYCGHLSAHRGGPMHCAECGSLDAAPTSSDSKPRSPKHRDSKTRSPKPRASKRRLPHGEAQGARDLQKWSKIRGGQGHQKLKGADHVPEEFTHYLEEVALRKKGRRRSKA